jgi:osmotically-inducible protein OsmY
MNYFKLKENGVLHTFSSGLLAAVTLTALTACATDQIESRPPTTTDSPTAVAVSDEQLADSEITETIKGEFLVARGVPSDAIEVETNEGIVTLSGSVNNILAKDRAQRITEMIKGVRSVVNTINVAPSGQSDAEIAGDISAALAADPATESWEINSTVNNGIVTLTGSVDSWQEKQLVAKVVKGVRGVTGLENNISVNPDVVRPDNEIRAEIEDALQWDARVDDGLIEVSVNDGIVTLGGSVGSLYEKSLATADAYVTGVSSVVNDPLTVEWWARDQMIRKQMYADVTDAEIQDAVKDALLYDPRVASFNVNVAVDNGEVMLTGNVDNLKAKNAAAQDASNTLGVWNVENQINVEPVDEVSQSDITTNVKNALERDPYVEASEVDVAVSDSMVTLTGVVDSYFEKWQAGDAAVRARGALAVDNNLTVDYEQLTYETSFYDWDATVFDYDYAIASKTDAEIAEDIGDELYWSPFVDREEVTVAVNNGVATLTGNVDTWNERNQATEEAYEGGAMSVVNQLDVDYDIQS